MDNSAKKIMSESLLERISVSNSQAIITDRWKNGKVGKIVDISRNGNYRFVDCLTDINGRPMICHRSIEEELLCPVIATGIIGYWLHNKDSQGIKKIFDGYFTLKRAQYEKLHEGDDDAWERDLNKEFILREHIPSEKDAIKTSEFIFEYLTEEDNKRIKRVAENYLKYARAKRKELPLLEYPSNRLIEDTFFAAYLNGGARECVHWFRMEYNLPYMGPHWNPGESKKTQLTGKWKYRHEVELPEYIKEEYEDFDDSVLVYSNGGMMEEINENLKKCSTQEDKVRYIVSLLQPFKDFADAFYPKARIDERKKAIEQDKKLKEYYAKIPKDAVDESIGKPIDPDAQIRAIDTTIERYKQDIEYWEKVQDRFYWFAQHGLTGEFTEEEKQDMCEYLGRWWSLMIMFSRRLAGVALTYGIKLMDIQKDCGIYLNWHFNITDYDDGKYVISIDHAKKLLAEIESQDKSTNINSQEEKIMNGMPMPLYISYNWESKPIADTICKDLFKAGIEFRRDEKDCPYRENIREFENQLASADKIIAIVTDKYMKSIHCMRELALISFYGSMEKRVFPIVDLEVRDSSSFVEYRSYWKGKHDELNNLSPFPGVHGPVLDELKDVDLIINELPKIWEYIRNVNSPSSEEMSKANCKKIIDNIQSQYI